MNQAVSIYGRQFSMQKPGGGTSVFRRRPAHGRAGRPGLQPLSRRRQRGACRKGAAVYLTLEERERFAYITNSPDHALIVTALDSENEQLDEMRHERDMATDEVKYFEENLDDKEKELAALEEKVEELTAELVELRPKDEPKPKPKARTARKAESIADLL